MHTLRISPLLRLRDFGVLGFRQQEGHFGRECIYVERPQLHNCSLHDVIIRASRITFQISVSVLFMVIYQLMKTEQMDPTHVLEGCWSSASLGLLVYQSHRNWEVLSKHGIRKLKSFLLSNEQFRVTVFYIFTSFALAPVLRTLTQTISTDTIHAVSIGLLFAHLLTNDYGVRGFFVSRTISINAAIIASICLSSRLPTNHHSIALITLAMESFVLFPIFVSLLWDSTLWLFVVVSTVGFSCYYASLQIFLVYIGCITFINIVMPFVFVISQECKNSMYGPWDEAVVEDSDEFN